MSKSKKINNLKDRGTVLVFQVDLDRFLHAWYEIETGHYYVEAFNDGMPRDWHAEFDNVEDFERTLRACGNLRRWGERFI